MFVGSCFHSLQQGNLATHCLGLLSTAPRTRERASCLRARWYCRRQLQAVSLPPRWRTAASRQQTNKAVCAPSSPVVSYCSAQAIFLACSCGMLCHTPCNPVCYEYEMKQKTCSAFASKCM